jgi:hypothetical protein
MHLTTEQVQSQAVYCIVYVGQTELDSICNSHWMCIKGHRKYACMLCIFHSSLCGLYIPGNYATYLALHNWFSFNLLALLGVLILGIVKMLCNVIISCTVVYIIENHNTNLIYFLICIYISGAGRHTYTANWSRGAFETARSLSEVEIAGWMGGATWLT